MTVEIVTILGAIIMAGLMALIGFVIVALRFHRLLKVHKQAILNLANLQISLAGVVADITKKQINPEVKGPGPNDPVQ